MDTIEQKDRAMAPPKTPKSPPLAPPYRKEFSLTSGAKFLGIGKGTLRAMIERKEVKATKNAKGHYLIEGAQIFQLEQNLEADAVKPVPTPVSTRASTVRDTPSSTGASKGASTGVDTSTSTGDNTPSDRRAGTVASDMHRTVVEMLEARLRDKDGTIRRLENDVEKWQTQSNSWQKHADNNLRLLEDHREKLVQDEPNIDLSKAGQGGHVWRNIAAIFAICSVLGLGYFYRADIADTLAKLTAPKVSTSAATEYESPQS